MSQGKTAYIRQSVNLEKTVEKKGQARAGSKTKKVVYQIKTSLSYVYSTIFSYKFGLLDK